MKHRIVVEFEAPNVSASCALCFVQDAIKSEIGHLPMTDPFSALDRSTVRAFDEGKETQKLRASLKSVIKHWDEFGPEHGFDETLHHARKAIA